MIRLKDVEMEYDNGTKAIRGISLTIEDGEFVFLVGPSGSGKSTIIKLLTGEVEPCAGRIMLNGFSVSADDCAQTGTDLSFLLIVHVVQNSACIEKLHRVNFFQHCLEFVAGHAESLELSGDDLIFAFCCLAVGLGDVKGHFHHCGELLD